MQEIDQGEIEGETDGARDGSGIKRWMVQAMDQGAIEGAMRWIREQ